MAEIKFYQDSAKTIQIYPAIDPDGNYPGVVVGLADNLLNHDGVTQTNTWNFRSAGGATHIGDGWAELLKVKGACSSSTIPETLHVNIGRDNQGVQAASCDITTFKATAAQTSTSQETYNFEYLPTLSYNSELVYTLNEVAFALAVSQTTGTYTFTYDANVTPLDSDSVITTFNKSTFITKVNETPGTYEFSYNGSNWQLDGSNVTLSQYGITTNGNETSGSTITVLYTSNAWYYNNAMISINTYGIVTTGTESVGDTIAISYTANNWTYNNDSITLATWGIAITEGTATAGDLIQIVYQPEVIGHVRVAHPVGMYTIGMNQFNLDDPNMYFANHTINTNGDITAENGKYVVFFRCLGNNTYTIYNTIGNSTIRVCYYAEEPSTSTTGMTILSEVTTTTPTETVVTNTNNVKHYTPSANGYLVIATSDIENLCAHLTWTGNADTVYETYWEHEIEFRYIDEHGNIITDYGLPAVNSTYYDEVDLTRYEYYKRVGRIENTAANMTMVQNLGVPYIYDADYIYYGIEEIIYHLPQDENYEYKVSEYGIEELINHVHTIALPVEMTVLYETNLKSKLKDGVEELSNKVTTVSNTSTNTEYPSAKCVYDLDIALRHILGLDVDTFSTTQTYAVGDYVIYNLKLWKCTTAVSTAGDWTGTDNWTESYLFIA